MQQIQLVTLRWWMILCLLFLPACEKAQPPSPEQPEPVPQKQPVEDDTAKTVNRLADKYYAFTLKHSPEVGYFAGVELSSHDGLEDNGPSAREAKHKFQRDMLKDLESIDPARLKGKTEWITHAYLLQQLRAENAVQICQLPLWNVNQMGGWHTGYAQVAQLQPVGTGELRQQSARRWAKFAGYIDQEIDNLIKGLGLGYSAPQAAVQRVIRQIDGLLETKPKDSPFYSPAERDDEPEFATITHQIVTEQIYPALQRYRDFLADSYLDNARETLSVLANPNGRECYQALLQSYTTLDKSGEEIFELGQQTVAANKAKVIELGKQAFGLENFAQIIEKVNSEKAEYFTDKQALLDFSRDTVQRAEKAMPSWVATMPTIDVEVVPFAEHEEGTGMSAHYRPGNEDRPGQYRIPLFQPEKQARSGAEVTAFHEAWPGHHLQVATGQSVEGLHPITRIIWFSGPGEGWARYSEALAEEMGLYTTITAPIKRRAWPARGMVVDPGIHLFGWTREQAIDFITESGRFPEPLDDAMIDRIAILPGQLTAYDAGGLEIMALRKLAEQAMGEDFDIRSFHDRILENGTIPLIQLRAHIEGWIEDYKAQRQ